MIDESPRPTTGRPGPFAHRGLLLLLGAGLLLVAGAAGILVVDHREVAPYYLADTHVRVPEVLIMSEKSWKRLKPADRALVARAAAQSVIFQRKLWQKTVARALARAEAAGCRVITPDDLPAFERATERVYRDYGSQLSNYIDRLRSVP